METPKYSYSQSVSCETMRTLWRNCKNNVGPMHDLKSRYTPELCDEKIALIDDADSLPDDAARTMVHEMLRTELVTLAHTCTRKWKRLKLYINGAFAGDEVRKIQYTGAGWNNYEAANDQNWQAVNDLMQSGANYIAENTDTLKGEDDENMPDDFPAEFNAAWTAFKLKRTAYDEAFTDSQTGTSEKVDAINACYSDAIDMGADGQTVFEDDEDLRKQFSFEAVGAQLAPSGPASFELTALVNGVAKPGVEISIENTDKELVTDAEGKALFTQMHQGPLQARVVCDGYAEQLVSVTLTAGVRKRIEVTLQPLFDGALKVGSERVETPVTESGSVQ